MNYRIALIACVCMMTSAQVLWAAPAEDQVTEISLERTPCFGSCPMDKVVLRSDGTASYNGMLYTERLGQYQGTFYQNDFKRLANFLKSQDYFGLKDRYTLGVSDLSGIITSVVRNGSRKTINNYGDSGPDSLWAVQAAIQGVVATIRWKKQEPTGTSGIRGIVIEKPSETDASSSIQILPKVSIAIYPESGGAAIVWDAADESGNFRIALPPGRYSISSRESSDSLFGRQGNRQVVEVLEGKFTSVIVEFVASSKS